MWEIRAARSHHRRRIFSHNRSLSEGAFVRGYFRQRCFELSAARISHDLGARGNAGCRRAVSSSSVNRDEHRTDESSIRQVFDSIEKNIAGSRLKQRANHWLKSSLPTKTNSNEQIHHRVFSLDNDAYELRRGFRAAKRYVGAYFGIEIVPEYLDEYQNHLERRISSFGDIGVGRDRYFPAA